MKRKHLLPLSFFMVVIFYDFATGFAHPVTPTLLVERALPGQWYGYAMSACAIGAFVVAPFWGKLCNYISTKKLIIFGAMGYLLGQSIMCLAYSGPVLLAGRVVAGLLSSAANIGIINYILNIGDEDNRSKYLTVYGTASMVCNAVGYFVGGLLGMISVEAAFIGQGAMLILCAITGFIFLEDDDDYKIKPERGLNMKEVNPFAAFVDAKDYMTPVLFCFFASIICVEMGISILENSFNYHIKDFFNLGSQYNGTIKSFIAIGGLVLNGTIGLWIIKHLKMSKVFVLINVLITGFVFVMNLFLKSMLPLSIAFIFYSIVYIIYTPVTQKVVSDESTPEISNSLMGFHQAMRSLGNVAGSFIQGVLYSINGFYGFYFSVVILGVGTVIAWIYAKMKESM